MTCWVIRTKRFVEFFTLVFAVTVSISISAFAFLVDICKGIMSSEIGLNICEIIARIKNYKSIINKKKKKSTMKQHF